MSRITPNTDMLTYADYCREADEGRWELIDREAFATAPAPSRLHQDFVVAPAAQIHPKLEGTDCRVYVAPFDVRLPKQDEADARVETVVQPDVAVTRDPRRLDDQGCRGTREWIRRILLPCSAAHD